MLILIGLAALIVIGQVLHHSGERWGWREAVGGVLSFIAAFLFAIALISLPFERIGTSAKIAEYEAVRQTVDEARARGESIESAAIQLKVAEMNQWRANRQYWNGTVFSLWIPTAVDVLEPIR